MSVGDPSVQCVVLAGGLGTRMHPLTIDLPKALLPVCGTPFAFYQLRWMRAHGVTDVVYCIGHLGQPIRDAIGSGERWGLRIRYCDEGGEQRGTAGALRLAAERGLLASECLVTYGDSFLRIDFGRVLSAFRATPDPAMLVVYENAGRWDSSNVRLAGDRVALYDRQHGSADPLQHIDYGLSALRQDAIMALPHGRSDLGELYRRLSLEGRLAAYVADERFYEIGSKQGLADFEQWVTAQTEAGACLV